MNDPDPARDPRAFLLEMRSQLQRAIARTNALLTDLDGWNSFHPEAPITADDHPEFLEAATDRRLMRRQLAEVERQLATGDYGPLPV